MGKAPGCVQGTHRSEKGRLGGRGLGGQQVPFVSPLPKPSDRASTFLLGVSLALVQFLPWYQMLEKPQDAMVAGVGSTD